MQYYKLIISLALISSLAACKNESVKKEETLSVDDDAFAAESLTSEIDEDLEDLSTQSLQKLSVSNCEVLDSSSSQLSLDYDQHPISGTSLILNGRIDRLYNNPNCSISIDGDAFARAHNLQLSGLYRNAYISSTSHPQVNYLGQTIGDGAVVTNTSGGWQLDVLGKMLNCTYKMAEKLSISIFLHHHLSLSLAHSRANSAPWFLESMLCITI